MTALSADKLRETQGTPQRGYGPAGVDIFYVGAMLCFDATGYLVPAADTVNLNFAGICSGYVDNSAGSAGDVDVEFEHGMVEKVAFSGSVTLAMGGESVTVADDATVELAGVSTNDVEVGTIERWEAGFVWVACRRGYAATPAA